MGHTDFIAQSISTNSIVHAAYTEDRAEGLLIESEDSVENGDVVEFWGELDGEPWRVHLDRANGF